MFSENRFNQNKPNIIDIVRSGMAIAKAKEAGSFNRFVQNTKPNQKLENYTSQLNKARLEHEKNKQDEQKDRNMLKYVFQVTSYDQLESIKNNYRQKNMTKDAIDRELVEMYKSILEYKNFDKSKVYNSMISKRKDDILDEMVSLQITAAKDIINILNNKKNSLTFDSPTEQLTMKPVPTQDRPEYKDTGISDMIRAKGKAVSYNKTGMSAERVEHTMSGICINDPSTSLTYADDSYDSAFDGYNRKKWYGRCDETSRINSKRRAKFINEDFNE